MKKIYLFISFLSISTFLIGQTATQVASPAQRSLRVSWLDQLVVDQYSAEPTTTSSLPYTPLSPAAQSNGKTATVTPLQLGRASNVYTFIRTQQNQVHADNDLGIVAFIHRQDVTIFGGGPAQSGKYRYDLSFDHGATFSTNIGPVNNLQTAPSRYPQITGLNPNNSSDPYSTYLTYAGPTLGTANNWAGQVTGVIPLTTTPPTAPTEAYSLLNGESSLQGGLTEGLDNEFWNVDLQLDQNFSTPGGIFLNKGVWNPSSEDVDWTRIDTLNPAHYIGYNGTPIIVNPNISFSPDGMTGWVSWIGDLNGGPDSTYLPVFAKTTDGGATWETPIEVDLNSDPMVAQYLTELWTQIDPVTGDTVPVSTGRATCSFDYDVTVDMNGNPHMAVVIGSGSSVDFPNPEYFYLGGIAKFMADVWSPDGGATWNITYVAPVLAWRTLVGNTNPLAMDNHCQISRTPNGDHVFYSWIDSDTSANTGSMNGIGYGVAENLAPNLRISGLRISDGYQMCYKRITDSDPTWNGKVLFPTMAPEVLLDSSGMVSLPIVSVELITNELLEPVQFWYFGEDSKIDISSAFHDPATLDLTWDANPCAPLVGVSDPVEDGVILGQSVPNPTSGEARIDFELPFNAEINLELTNVYGQRVGTIAEGNFAAGKHQVKIDTRDLAVGIYFYHLQTNGNVTTKKMIVTK